MRVHAHTRVERILPAKASAWRAARCGPTRSSSPPALERRARPRRGPRAPARAAQGPARAAARRADVRHKVFDGAYLAAVAAPDAGLQVSTVIETTWQGDVLVGSSRERRGSTPPSTPRSPRRCSRCGAADARGAGPRGRRLGRAAAVAAGGLPALGPSRAGVWVATGHEGAGSALGPISGELLAAAMSGETPALDLAPFDPDRFGARRSARRHSAPSPSGSRMTLALGDVVDQRGLGRRRVGAAVVAASSPPRPRRSSARRAAPRAPRAGPRAAAGDRASGRGSPAGRRRPRRAGSRRPRGAARRTRRPATAPCSGPGRPSARPCPARGSASPRRCAPRRGRPGRRPRPRYCRAPPRPPPRRAPRRRRSATARSSGSSSTGGVVNQRTGAPGSGVLELRRLQPAATIARQASPVAVTRSRGWVANGIPRLRKRR